MHDLTGIQRDLLYIIAGLNRPNGLEVGAELEEYYQIEINSTQLYPHGKGYHAGYDFGKKKRRKHKRHDLDRKSYYDGSKAGYFGKKKRGKHTGYKAGYRDGKKKARKDREDRKAGGRRKKEKK